MGVKILIEKINEFKANQTCSADDWEYDLSDELRKLWESFEPKSLTDGIDPDSRRWYETSESYFRLNTGDIVGVRLVTQTYSEMQEIEFCYNTIELFEGEEFKTVSYKKKA